MVNWQVRLELIRVILLDQFNDIFPVKLTFGLQAVVVLVFDMYHKLIFRSLHAQRYPSKFREYYCALYFFPLDIIDVLCRDSQDPRVTKEATIRPLFNNIRIEKPFTLFQ